MGKRTPQSAAKRAREQALREKRERKAAKKAAAALARDRSATVAEGARPLPERAAQSSDGPDRDDTTTQG